MGDLAAAVAIEEGVMEGVKGKKATAGRQGRRFCSGFGALHVATRAKATRISFGCMKRSEVRRDMSMYYAHMYTAISISTCSHAAGCFCAKRCQLVVFARRQQDSKMAR